MKCEGNVGTSKITWNKVFKRSSLKIQVKVCICLGRHTKRAELDAILWIMTGHSGFLLEVALLEDWTDCPARGNHAELCTAPLLTGAIAVPPKLSAELDEPLKEPLKAERCPGVWTDFSLDLAQTVEAFSVAIKKHQITDNNFKIFRQAE